MRLRIIKSILWALTGLGAAIIIMRIIHGPGSVTALTDIIPWGLWKGGGVVALVAIGGAGFTVAMFVYVFGWKRYQPVVRGAVLLALMCYTSVAIGLTFDIGIWWRIVFPVVFWQIHSVLFEVAWCIMLYLSVLVFEFGHTLLDRFGWHRMASVAHKLTIAFVIAGISLSTLHQSSLGTLFLATPFRLHPLWHTDFLPLLFFISSIGIGCLTISVATILVHRLYGAEIPRNALAGLAGISAVVMAAYAVLKVGEVVFAGEAGLLAQLTWDTANFWIELAFSAVLPVVLLSFRRYRENPSALLWIGLCAIVGLSLNRVNVSGLATLSITHADYLPAWSEWAVTAGVLSAAALVYLFAVEKLGVFASITSEHVDAAHQRGSSPALLFFRSQPLGGVRLYSFLFVLAAAFSFGCLSNDGVFGVAPEATPVSPPRISGLSRAEVFTNTGTPTGGRDELLIIDGNRDSNYVLFDHATHIERAKTSGLAPTCDSCHHANTPNARATPCSSCHRDMYLETDIFDHNQHEVAFGGNDGCVRCHRDPELPKVRANVDCLECHRDLRSSSSRVPVPQDKRVQLAASYLDAMHGLCVECHREARETTPTLPESLDTCETCHRAWPELELPVPD